MTMVTKRIWFFLVSLSTLITLFIILVADYSNTNERHENDNTKLYIGNSTRMSNLYLQVLSTRKSTGRQPNKRIEAHKRELLLAIEHYESHPSYNMDPYGVSKYPRDPREHRFTLDDILCDFKSIPITTLKKTDVWNVQSIAYGLFPKSDMFEGKHYKSCALVSSSGNILGSGMGSKIDQHDLVVRFNDAPTKGFENDVGSKTNIRVVNSHLVSVLTGGKFNSMDLYDGAENLLWFDVPMYGQSTKEWLLHPIFKKFVPQYLSRQKMNKTNHSYILTPEVVWNQYRVMSKYSDYKMTYKPPSSGFMALLIMMNFCDFVYMYEFIPSLRNSDKCYYYKVGKTQNYSLSSPHPMALQKKFLLLLNQLDDKSTFIDGVSKIPGFSQLKCHS